MELLRGLCGEDEMHFQLTRELLSIEKSHKSMLRRAGLFKALEQAFYRNFYDDEEDAVGRARQRRDALGTARDRAFDQASIMIQDITEDPVEHDEAKR